MIAKDQSQLILSDKKNYDILFTFTKKDNLYVIYTNNEIDPDGFIKTYAGIYEKIGDKESLLPIENEEDWETIEDLLNKLDSNEVK